MARQIPQRVPVFVACEGESERGYARLLERFADEGAGAANRTRFHLEIEMLGGGGNPAYMLNDAVRRRDKASARGRRRFMACFCMFDSDRLHEVNAVGGQQGIDQRAQAAGMRIIWQVPNHEGLLLAHFEPGNRQVARPVHDVISRLERHIPNYPERKPMSADHLGPWIQFDQIRAVAEQEPALADLLKTLKLTK